MHTGAVVPLACEAFVDYNLDAVTLSRQEVEAIRLRATRLAVITCGTDALAGDPLSRMALSNGALWGAVQRIIAAVGPTVVLGGGDDGRPHPLDPVVEAEAAGEEPEAEGDLHRVLRP